MKKIRVAINGFGRIGRALVRLVYQDPEIELVALNDLGDAKNLAYLLRYDTVYGKAPFPIEAVEGGALSIDGKDVPIFAEPDPSKLPWKDLQVDVVVEATGRFTDYDQARAHITAGARRVVLSAPAKGGTEGGATVLMGLDDEKLATCDISSNASCTTNAVSPLIAILDELVGIEHALLNTTHAYTGSQRIVDGVSKKDWREGRAAAQNIIPSSTGAAIAVTRAYPALEGKFDGISLRVPVAVGSIADVTFVAKRDTTALEINDLLRKAAKEKRWQGIFRASDEELVSSDIVGDTHASIADLPMTRVVGGRLVKVLAWYDNEMGYAETLRRHIVKIGQYL